jgi:hypothetical protein
MSPFVTTDQKINLHVGFKDIEDRIFIKIDGVGEYFVPEAVERQAHQHLDFDLMSPEDQALVILHYVLKAATQVK